MEDLSVDWKENIQLIYYEAFLIILNLKNFTYTKSCHLLTHINKKRKHYFKYSSVILLMNGGGLFILLNS